MTSPHPIHRPKEHVTAYTLATATEIAAAFPAATLDTSLAAFDKAVRTESVLARIAIEVWATQFGVVPVDGQPDRHLPDFRCAPGAMARFRPGVAESVLRAAKAAGAFGVPGILVAQKSGNRGGVRIRFFTEVPDGGGISADTHWICPETMILEGTTGAWAVWEMLFRIRHQVAKAARDRGFLR